MSLKFNLSFIGVLVMTLHCIQWWGSISEALRSVIIPLLPSLPGQLWLKVESHPGVMTKAYWVSLISCHAITFTFRLITLRKAWTLLSWQQWVKLYYCCSSKMIVLALNNQQRLICHEMNKSNQIIWRIVVVPLGVPSLSWMGLKWFWFFKNLQVIFAYYNTLLIAFKYERFTSIKWL